MSRRQRDNKGVGFREYTSVYVDDKMVKRFPRPREAHEYAEELRAKGQDAKVMRELVRVGGVG